MDDFFRQKAHHEKSFEELLDLQTAVLNDKSRVFLGKYVGKYRQNVSKITTYPNGGDHVRTIFILDKSNLLMCLPLKTGTTNWQRTLASIMTYESTGEFLGPIH